jgi:hypothetical protein
MSVLENQANRPEEYEDCKQCNMSRFQHKDKWLAYGYDGHEFIPSGINHLLEWMNEGR